MKNSLSFFLLLTSFLANGQYQNKHHSVFSFLRQHPRIEVVIPSVKTSFHTSSINLLVPSHDYVTSSSIGLTQSLESVPAWSASPMIFPHEHRVQGSQTYDIQGKPQFSSAALNFRSKKRH
ncbi:MAG TPA: hypothetical protein VIM65_24750 [Cyclobacteriaceae bacterium]